MRKYILLLICLSFLFTACNNEEIPTEETESSLDTESESSDAMQLVDLSKRNRETINLEELMEVKPALNISEHVIKIEGDASVDDYVFAEGKLYYAIGYASYYYPFIREEEELPAFKNEYNTQIRVYDVATGEDTVLYQYQKDYAVEIGDMRCKDGCLIWTEAESEEYDWMMCEQTLNLTDGSMSYELFYEQLYDYVKESDKPVMVGDVVTEYQHGNRWTKITVKNEEQVTELGVKGLVTAAMSNGSVCIWNVPTSEDNLHIYDMVNDRYYSMGFDYVFYGGFGIYEQWLLMNLSDGLYAYNIPEGCYAKLTDSSIGSMSTTDEGIYGGTYDRENNELTVLYIE